MKKIGKRFVAILLIVTIFFQIPSTVCADFVVRDDLRAYSTSVTREDLKAYSEVNALMASGIKAPETEPPIAIDWEKDTEVIVESFVDAAEQAAVDVAVDKIFSKEAAMYWNFVELLDSITGFLEMKGEHVLTRIIETIGVGGGFALTILGMIIPFPWSVIFSVLGGFLAIYLSSDYTVETMDDILDYWFGQVKTPDGVNALKPNIYIYSDVLRTVDITFGYPELLTAVIPDYSGRWRVAVGEEGLLTCEDGSQYGYLFYESRTEKHLFQTKAGYRIPAGHRAETFSEILKEMGFSKKEISDFIEFWEQKLLKGRDYIMYPQDTKTVDMAMPMTITGQPGAINRIWFAFMQDTGQHIQTPETIYLDRNTDYYVVEWGGMIFDE